MTSPWTLLAFSFAAGGLLGIAVVALFNESASVPSNVFATDTLNPPADPQSTGTLSTALTWTATSDTYATGYRVLRSATAGGPYTQVGEVTPRTTTAFNESPADGTYYYVVRSFYENWESVYSAEVTVIIAGG